MPEPNIVLAAANSGIAKELYADLKFWLARVAGLLKKGARHSNAGRFDSPEELLRALKAGTVKDGDRVVVHCKPSPFGPFLRDHFISPMVGMAKGRRHGPAIVGGPLALFGQAMSHLAPMGLFPRPGTGVSQVCLYPADTPAAGMLTMIPGMAPNVVYVPAILADRHVPSCHMPCNVAGDVRLVDASALESAGFGAEVYEELRQVGGVWTLDASGDDSECSPLSDGVTGEFWGGLYAAGHMEFVEGVPSVESIVEVLRKNISSEEGDVEVLPNLAGRREISICGNGIRACLDTQAPIFSLHMDAELGFGFAAARKRFDNVSLSVLHGLKEACESQNVKLGNAMDLDFSYTKGAEAYTVLRSLAADNVTNPVLVAIRDWHRTRTGALPQKAG